MLSNVLIKCQHRNPNVPVKVEELLNTDSEVNTEIEKEKRSTNKLRIQLNMVNVTTGTKFAIFQGSGNTDKRFKMVAWERFSREKSYLEIGIFLINIIQHLDAILTPSSPGRSEASVQKELTRARRVSLAQFGSTGSPHNSWMLIVI